MKALVFDQPGRPEDVLTLQDLPQPVPAHGEVLVRMVASPINPSDLLYIEGRYGIKPSFPATPGFEGVGVVESSGGGLLGWLRKGKRVAVLNDRRGNWAEYTTTTSRQVIPISDDIPDEQAATFFVNPMTAYILTQKVLRVPPGAWLLQSAAGSALGKMMIRLGKKYGFRTLNLVRRPEQIAELKQLGGDAVLLTGSGSLSAEILRLTDGQGVRYALDAVGGAIGTEVIQALAPGGRAVLYGLLSGEPVSVDPRFLITGSKTVQGFWLADWAKQQRVLSMLRIIRQVRQLIRDGVLQTDAITPFAIEDYRSALIHAQTPGKAGKALLKFGGA